jgi:hypothetical protein
LSPPEHPTDKELKELSMFFLQYTRVDETGKWEPCQFSERQLDGITPDFILIFEHVFEESFRFLHRTDDFMAWFDTMTGIRKRYFRLLVLLQLQDIDRRLKRANKEGAISCRIFSLYYTTLALLDSERAIIDNGFRVLKSHDGQQTCWSGLNVDNGPQKDLIVRRFRTLKSLGSFFDILNPFHLSPWDPRYRANFLCILKSQLYAGGFSSDFAWEARVLCCIKTILDSSYATISKSDWVRSSEQDTTEDKVRDQPGKEREHREEEGNSNGGGEKSDGWKWLDEKIKILGEGKRRREREEPDKRPRSGEGYNSYECYGE